MLGTDASTSLSEGQVYGSLVLDGFDAVLYGVGLWFFLSTWWSQPFWKVRGVLDRRPIVLMLPLLAATFDVLENVATGVGIEWTGDGLRYRDDTWAVVVATLSWIKWFLLAGRADRHVRGARRRAPSERPPLGRAMPRHRPRMTSPIPRSVSVAQEAASAAGYTAGVLRALEHDGVLADADVMAAVSGGTYFAGAYASLGASAGPTNADNRARYLEGAALDDPFAPLDSAQSPRVSHHRYLENDPGGFALALLRALVSVLFNVAVVLSVTIIVAWPIGRLLGSRYVDPRLHDLRTEVPDLHTVFEVPARLWLPPRRCCSSR